RNSQLYLKKTLTTIVTKAQSNHAIEVIVYIDVEINNIIILLDRNDDTTNKAFIDDIKQYNPSIYYRDNPKRKNSPNSIHSKRGVKLLILGGDEIYNKGYDEICTAGFWVKDVKKPVDDYIVTAAHCIDPNNLSPVHNFFQRAPLQQPELKKNLGQMDLIITNMVSDGGDSGSPVIHLQDLQNLPWVGLNGLHIAGGYSRKLGYVTLALKLEKILNTDKIELVLGE
ncbi:32075_t:CDS:2, partial [Racocetra persica]